MLAYMHFRYRSRLIIHQSLGFQFVTRESYVETTKVEQLNEEILQAEGRNLWSNCWRKCGLEQAMGFSRTSNNHCVTFLHFCLRLLWALEAATLAVPHQHPTHRSHNFLQLEAHPLHHLGNMDGILQVCEAHSPFQHYLHI